MGLAIAAVHNCPHGMLAVFFGIVGVLHRCVTLHTSYAVLYDPYRTRYVITIALANLTGAGESYHFRVAFSHRSRGNGVDHESEADHQASGHSVSGRPSAAGRPAGDPFH
jgi:hypothetical protein